MGSMVTKAMAMNSAQFDPLPNLLRRPPAGRRQRDRHRALLEFTNHRAQLGGLCEVSLEFAALGFGQPAQHVKSGGVLEQVEVRHGGLSAPCARTAAPDESGP